MFQFIRLANPRKCVPDNSHVGARRAELDRCRKSGRGASPKACTSWLPKTPDVLDEFVNITGHSDVSSSAFSLSALHQRTIALQVAVAGEDRLLKGHGEFASDFDFGNVLRIVLPKNAGCEFMIVEDRWNGEIVSGQSCGCDYLIRL